MGEGTGRDDDGGRGALGPPLPDDLPAADRGLLRLLGVAGLSLMVGALLGLWLAPESPEQLARELAATRLELAKAERRAAEVAVGGAPTSGHLAPADRLRQEHHAHLYAESLRRVGAQAAAELMEWFVRQWNRLLDSPHPDDRTGRRAEVLSLLVGGMAQNLNPGDYVAWQEEFFSAGWLGDVHFDLDGDGLPGSRRAKNPHDGFANVSLCQVAMALNLAMTDARIFIAPELRCDRVDARMSVFLQGRSLDDALSDFVRAVRDLGFVVVDREEKSRRLVLLGKRLPAPPP